jgi:alanine dehydrogenase
MRIMEGLNAMPMLLLSILLDDGVVETCVRDGYWRRSLTAYKGFLTHEETSGIQGRPWVRPEELLGIADRPDLDYAPPATTTRSDNFYPKSAWAGIRTDKP